MLSSNSNLGFPRKIVVYYLLFSLIAISFLALGLLHASHTVMDSRTTSSCLSRIGKTAAALELEYLRNGSGKLQTVAHNHLGTSTGIQEFSIVSLEGTILANSTQQHVGEIAHEKKGELLRWGNVSGVQYQDNQGNTHSEYRVPLVAHEEHFGSLRITVRQLNLWSSLAEIVHLAPAAILLPLVFIAAGGLLLSRLVTPFAKVNKQLQVIARQRPTTEINLKPLPANDVVSLGWNRIVELLKRNNESLAGGGLQSRLLKVVDSREQNEYRKVLQNLTDGVAVTDINGQVKFANRAIAVLLGTEIEDEELVGLELEAKIIRNTNAIIEEPLFEESSGQCSAVTEVIRQGATDQRTLRIARQPIQEKKPSEFVWSIRDITQQKLTEQSRDQFINAATHELRTPLSNIKAYAETLANCDDVKVEQQKEFCNIINSEVTRLARFVDDLLCISSMETGSLIINRQRTVVSRMFDEVKAKVQPLMQQKQIDFIVKLPEKMDELQLDKDKIVAVLVNLLGNAAKYTPIKGHVSLRVKIDAATLQVEVEDTGVGISETEIPKVFDKFFRSNDPRVQEETGTGLGLSLAREVIRLHGGDITVESQINQGTTFKAAIPII